MYFNCLLRSVHEPVFSIYSHASIMYVCIYHHVAVVVVVFTLTQQYNE